MLMNRKYATHEYLLIYNTVDRTATIRGFYILIESTYFKKNSYNPIIVEFITSHDMYRLIFESEKIVDI